MSRREGKQSRIWTLRRNISARKDSSWLTGPKFITSLAGIADRGLSHTLHFRETLQIEPSASCTVFLKSEPTFIKEFLSPPVRVAP